jgi:RNA polymerase sigma factor (sigma-70 family)
VNNDGLKHLLTGCLNNDRRSQGALYERFYSYALSVALPYCAHEEEAREVVNDAFLKVFTGIGRYDPAFAFATWLRTIVVRTAINRYKSRQNELVLYDLTEGLDIPMEDDFLSKMAVEDLLRLVQKLPPAYRMTLNLFALEGFSHAEISEMLGISVGASKSNLSRAKAKLKQMLTDYLPKKYG